MSLFFGAEDVVRALLVFTSSILHYFEFCCSYAALCCLFVLGRILRNYLAVCRGPALLGKRLEIDFWRVFGEGLVRRLFVLVLGLLLRVCAALTGRTSK
jgi:hypothetical protein